MCEITDKEVKQMIKYDFKETYELNEIEKKTVEKINIYPYFTCHNNANKTHKVCCIKRRVSPLTIINTK